MASTSAAPPITGEANMEIAPPSSSSSSTTTTTTSTAAAAAAKWTTPPSVPTLPAKFPGLESLSIKKREQLFLYHAFKPVAAGAPFVRKAGKA